MTINAFGARPAGKSVASAFFGILGTLAIFVVSFTFFVISPFLLMIVAYVLYLVMRPRPTRKDDAGAPGEGGAQSATGFGAGAL